MHPSGRWRPSSRPSKQTGEPTGWSLTNEPNQVYNRPPRARGLPNNDRRLQNPGGGRGEGRGSSTAPLASKAKPPFTKLTPWVTTGSSWEGGSELDKEEERMRRGHDSPSSTTPPPKAPTPRPSKQSNTGTDRQGKGQSSYLRKFFFFAGEREEPLKETFAG